MSFTPLAIGTSATPVKTPTAQDIANLLSCGALDLGLLNGLLKVIGDRVDAIDAADNAIVSAVYDETSNTLTFTMQDGPSVAVPLAGLISDAVATGIITGSSYNAATNILTLTTANGDAINLDMTAVISDAVASAIMPAGGIIMWSGGAVPSGWALCDGSAGTPDLRDRFVVAAGPTYPAGSTGGAAAHNHGGTTGDTQLTVADLPNHRHFTVIPSTATGAGASAGVSPYEASNSGGDQEYSLDFAATEPTASRTSGAVTMAGGSITPSAGHDHSINSASSLPPYYALAFIMKV